MANIILSPSMSLPVPVPGVDPGPDYAFNIDSCFLLLDGHNHAPGRGVQITPSGLNINIDLPFMGNNATTLRSVRFTPQGSPLVGATDLGALYESGVDLYYNDGNGNQIRLTQSGSPAGASGSITGLVPPASVSYVSGNQTFVFQSAVNTAANIDVASVILRNLTAGSPGLTLQPPTLGSSYAITLPQLPAQIAFMTLNNAGQINTQIAVGTLVRTISVNTTLVVNDNKVLCDASSGSFNVTLPAANASIQLGIQPEITIIKIDSSPYVVNVLPNGSDTIGGELSQLIDTVNQSLTLFSDGASNWYFY